MAQKHLVPEVAVFLDKERHLRFDFNAAAAFEQATGKSMFDAAVWSSPTATDLRALLWSLMVHEDKELTIEHVGSFIHFGNITELSTKLSEVYVLNTPTPDGNSPPLM